MTLSASRQVLRIMHTASCTHTQHTQHSHLRRQANGQPASSTAPQGRVRVGLTHHGVVSVGRLAGQHHAVRAVQNLHSTGGHTHTQRVGSGQVRSREAVWEAHTYTHTACHERLKDSTTAGQGRVGYDRVGQARVRLPRWRRLRTPPWWVWGW